ncbi:hypothetical protein, partial [Lacticaseibacillus thailandensis]|uniref:hypothetical protein n=1 Tax=Lacticaseibacillus thailandensis TaxID=381741 RepID=UPI00138F7B31
QQETKANEAAAEKNNTRFGGATVSDPSVKTNTSFNDYKQQEDQNLADKVAGEKAGSQYGETGATLPSLDGKSDAYKNAFSEASLRVLPSTPRLWPLQHWPSSVLTKPTRPSTTTSSRKTRT